jgi:4-hydroxy-tetrahydrodipicolinate synthase
MSETTERKKYAGTWTAIITPFKDDGSLDEEALRGLVRRQVDGGVTGVVPVGTTGESPTTTMEEDRKIFEIVVDEVGGRALVMAGTGSNSTADAVKYTKNAKEAGCDCCLVVSPYYNKPTAEGLRRHYAEVANVGLPVIVYNIKGRTGANIETDVLMEIAEHEMVVGVKEASGDLDQMKEVIERSTDDFCVLSGDDGLTLDLIRMGGDGVVSVASNIVPGQISEMVNHALEGNFEEAEKIGSHFEQFFNDLFCETNPIPVKYVAHKMGLCGLNYRLPMCEPSSEGMETLDQLMKNYNL